MSVERDRLDLLVQEVYGSVPKGPPGGRVKPFRRCTRCGIDTRRPDMCIDCEGLTR